jgi:hypothetical protein
LLGDILLFTDTDLFSNRIASYIKTAATKSSKVMMVELSSGISVSSVLKDPFWEGNSPSRIFFFFFFVVGYYCLFGIFLTTGDILYIAASNESISIEALSSQFKLLSNALSLTQSVAAFKFKTVPRLWLVTRNATWVGDEELNLLSSPIWGFGASVCMEHPELACKRVDLDSDEV